MSRVVEAIFGQGGYLARAVGKKYEERIGQTEFARAVYDSIESGTHLVAEAPCGVGKSLGYAAPAIAHAVANGRKVIIVTASNALADQLVSKDLPALAKALPWPFTYGVLKGRSNYLCPYEAERATERGLVPTEVAELHELKSWARETRDGDISARDVLPSKRVRLRVITTSEDCIGDECVHLERCHYERAKKASSEVDVLVTNYHLLFASQRLAAKGVPPVLPKFDIVILDEAHEAPDIAREFYGFSTGSAAIERVAKFAEEAGRSGMAANLRDVWAPLAARLVAWQEDRRERRLTGPVPVDHSKVDAALALIERSLREKRKVEQVATTRERLDEWLTCEDDRCVYWLELGEKGQLGMKSRVLEIGPVIRRDVFDAARTVIACSATLKVNGSFAFAQRELGPPAAAKTLDVASPFNFRAQARLIVPSAFPDPRDPEYTAAVAQAVEDVIHACGGRTLALFTSHAMVDAVHKHLVASLGGKYPLYRQGGDLSARELTERFKKKKDSVLLATQSFWTGIDVPGDALTGLVINKLPFPPPDDPVASAMAARSPSAFFDYTVPKASLLLKQGVGRLIRSQTDVGVAVILDNRLIRKGYGNSVLRSLPPMPLSTKLEDIATFLRQKGVAA